MSLQFKHGSYTTKNFDMCADAVKEFNKAAKDEKVDKQKMLKAARAVDKYLGMEKNAKDKGSATQAQLDSFMSAVEDAKTAISDAELKGHTYHKWHIADMKKYAKAEVKEGLGDMAHMAEKDHEVQMARADLYKIAKYSIKLHEMLKNVSEAEGLEGWVQSKITKAADYLGSVYHHLDYEQATGELGEGKSPHKKGSKKYKKHMAAMHAESAKDEYKSYLRHKLAEKQAMKKAATDVAYNESTDLDSIRKFVKSQREAPDQVLYQMMMAPDTYGHSASNFVRSWYEKTKEENGLNDVDSALEIMVDELGINENFADGKVKQGTRVYDERTLTKGEEGKREKYVKGMKKAKGDFKKRYGKDAEAVMYATATKMAKK